MSTRAATAGPTADAADGFTTADLVADVIAFADALGLLLGFSMGATTALNVAAPTRSCHGISPDREPRAVSRGTRWTPIGSSART